jgi:competence protein ComEC
VFGPSFQMSFASVIAIIAFHGSAPAKRFLAAREEGYCFAWAASRCCSRRTRDRTGADADRAVPFPPRGIYGAAANVIAIPLTTFVTMPLIALALVLDVVGRAAGVVADGQVARTAVAGARDGGAAWRGDAYASMPPGVFALFVAGRRLWLRCGPDRCACGPGSGGVAALVFATAPARHPGIGDGRHVGVTGGAKPLVLRQTRGDYTRENLLKWPGWRERPPARHLARRGLQRRFLPDRAERGGRSFAVLMARAGSGGDRELKRACAAADIVIADRRLPRTCLPRMLKADRAAGTDRRARHRSCRWHRAHRGRNQGTTAGIAGGRRAGRTAVAATDQ